MLAVYFVLCFSWLIENCLDHLMLLSRTFGVMPVQAKCTIVPLYPPFLPPALHFITVALWSTPALSQHIFNSQRSLQREEYWLLHHVQIKFQPFRVLCNCQVHWNPDTSSRNLPVTLAACTWLFSVAHGLTSSPEMDGIAEVCTGRFLYLDPVPGMTLA